MVILSAIAFLEPRLDPDGQAADKMDPVLVPWSSVQRGKNIKDMNMTTQALEHRGGHCRARKVSLRPRG